MPADSALEVGAVKAVELITATAMPSALPEMAVCMYWTICGTAEVAEPPHFGLGMPEQRGSVSEAVLGGHEERVRGDVVDEPEVPRRGLREVARHVGGTGTRAGAGRLLVPFDAEQAASRADAAAVALTSPVPLSSTRRVCPSFMLRVSMASSTLGSIFFFISKPPDGFLGAACWPPLPHWIDCLGMLAASPRRPQAGSTAQHRVQARAMAIVIRAQTPPLHCHLTSLSRGDPPGSPPEAGDDGACMVPGCPGRAGHGRFREEQDGRAAAGMQRRMLALTLKTRPKQPGCVAIS